MTFDKSAMTPRTFANAYFLPVTTEEEEARA
jgi:hypothetical protein